MLLASPSPHFYMLSRNQPPNLLIVYEYTFLTLVKIHDLSLKIKIVGICVMAKIWSYKLPLQYRPVGVAGGRGGGGSWPMPPPHFWGENFKKRRLPLYRQKYCVHNTRQFPFQFQKNMFLGLIFFRALSLSNSFLRACSSWQSLLTATCFISVLLN